MEVKLALDEDFTHLLKCPERTGKRNEGIATRRESGLSRPHIRDSLEEMEAIVSHRGEPVQDHSLDTTAGTKSGLRERTHHADIGPPIDDRHPSFCQRTSQLLGKRKKRWRAATRGRRVDRNGSDRRHYRKSYQTGPILTMAGSGFPGVHLLVRIRYHP